MEEEGGEVQLSVFWRSSQVSSLVHFCLFVFFSYFVFFVFILLYLLRCFAWMVKLMLPMLLCQTRFNATLKVIFVL